MPTWGMSGHLLQKVSTSIGLVAFKRAISRYKPLQIEILAMELLITPWLPSKQDNPGKNTNSTGPPPPPPPRESKIESQIL